MPVTPFLTVPNTPRSEKTYVNEECRQNALKMNRENDWFSHAQDSSRTAAPCQTSEKRHYETQRTPRPSSARWWGVDKEPIRAARHGTPESRKIQQKLEAHNQHTWYKHGTGVPDPLHLNTNKPKSRRSACSEARARLAAGNSNEWFRHERAPSNATSPENGQSASPITDGHAGGTAGASSIRRHKDLSGSISWQQNDVSNTTTPTPRVSKRAPCPYEIDDGIQNEATPRGHSRIISPDADNYQRRNNEGSASVWYSHDLSNLSPQDRQNLPRPQKGTNEFANRTKSESEDWYSFRGVLNSPTTNGGGSKDVKTKAISTENGSASKVSHESIQQCKKELDDQISTGAQNLSKMNLNKTTGPANGQSDQVNGKEAQPVGNGYKHFVRIDDYLEPEW